MEYSNFNTAQRRGENFGFEGFMGLYRWEKGNLMFNKTLNTIFVQMTAKG